MTEKRSASLQAASAWLLPDESVRLRRNEVHIWLIPLNLQEASASELCGFLSRDEVERAHQFHFKRDRLQFKAARAALRLILGRYLNTAPRSLVFVEGPKGKPELLYTFGHRNVKFNLSHSRGLALLAVAENLCVGIDLEFVDQTFATEELAVVFLPQTKSERCSHWLPLEEERLSTTAGRERKPTSRRSVRDFQFLWKVSAWLLGPVFRRR